MKKKMMSTDILILTGKIYAKEILIMELEQIITNNTDLKFKTIDYKGIADDVINLVPILKRELDKLKKDIV